MGFPFLNGYLPLSNEVVFQSYRTMRPDDDDHRDEMLHYTILLASDGGGLVKTKTVEVVRVLPEGLRPTEGRCDTDRGGGWGVGGGWGSAWQTRRRTTACLSVVSRVPKRPKRRGPGRTPGLFTVHNKNRVEANGRGQRLDSAEETLMGESPLGPRASYCGLLPKICGSYDT